METTIRGFMIHYIYLVVLVKVKIMKYALSEIKERHTAWYKGVFTVPISECASQKMGT